MRDGGGAKSVTEFMHCTATSVWDGSEMGDASHLSVQGVSQMGDASHLSVQGGDEFMHSTAASVLNGSQAGDASQFSVRDGSQMGDASHTSAAASVWGDSQVGEAQDTDGLEPDLFGDVMPPIDEETAVLPRGRWVLYYRFVLHD